MAAPFVRTSVPGVYRRGGRYVVTFTDPSGVRRKRSAATLAEARVLKAALATDVARGDFRELSTVRFDACAREWGRTYQGRTGRGIRSTTLDEYRRDLEIDAIPFLGARRLAEIEPRHIKALARLVADRGVAPATVRTVMAPVRALFATALEESLIRSNPCAGLRSPEGAPRVRRRPTRRVRSRRTSWRASSTRRRPSGASSSASWPRRG